MDLRPRLPVRSGAHALRGGLARSAGPEMKREFLSNSQTQMQSSRVSTPSQVHTCFCGKPTQRRWDHYVVSRSGLHGPRCPSPMIGPWVHSAGSFGTDCWCIQPPAQPTKADSGDRVQQVWGSPMLPIHGPRGPRASRANDNLVVRRLGQRFLRGRSVNRLCRPYSLTATTDLWNAATDNRYVSECLLRHLYKDRRRPVACGVR